MKKIIIIGIVFLFLCVYVVLNKPQEKESELTTSSGRSLLWNVQAIDSMKFSRDVAREKNTDSSFDQTIEDQVRLIAETGATHISIGTPYEEEFVPFMKRWVLYAREYNLNVWFRGNTAGWEKWFDYKTNTPEEHTKIVVSYILKHPELFENGDIFSSCPECENGAVGDPRQTGKVAEYKKFLISEYNQVEEAFSKINKRVAANYFSMNGDVANLIMDVPTTAALDGIVVIDHYVKTPEKLNADVTALAQKSKGKIVLGEWGAPIPDIHGKFTDEQQAQWINEALALLSKNKNVVGLNYWTSFGGSSSLWASATQQTKAALVLTDYYTPQVITGVVMNQIDNTVAGAKVSVGEVDTKTNLRGEYTLKIYPGEDSLFISADGYETKEIKVSKESSTYDVILSHSSNNLLVRISKLLKDFFAPIAGK